MSLNGFEHEFQWMIMDDYGLPSFAQFNLLGVRAPLFRYTQLQTSGREIIFKNYVFWVVGCIMLHRCASPKQGCEELALDVDLFFRYCIFWVPCQNSGI